ncbi:MAG: ABC transporter permease subunit [Candidatus Sericytochromatia bacterium]|nr:ABC transporter permease subunit [Candidatus Tanganyikabacteria bacterium]
MTTLIGFLLIGVAAYFLSFRLAPAAFRGALRLLGFTGKLNPLTERRIARFRRIRRGYGAFVLIVTAFVASLFLELFVNDLPLYIRYGDKARFPAVAAWSGFVLPWTSPKTDLMAADYGLKAGGGLETRKFAAWVGDPAKLTEEANAIEQGIVDDEKRFRTVMQQQAQTKGLTYDPTLPLPDAKLADYAERRENAKALLALQKDLQAGKAQIVMPLWPYSPTEQLLGLPGTPPHKPFTPGVPLLGTDSAGHDVVAQLLYGFRVGMGFALMVTISGYLIGVVAGALMGFYGGWIDIGMQRFIEIWGSLPFFFIIMILASILQPNFWVLSFLLIVLAAWEGITYTMRGEFYRERSRDYVQAARALGVRDWKLMLRHILPNALVPIVTLAPFSIVGNMSTLVALDYLHFGLPPNTPSWGALLDQGANNIVNHPQLVFIPTLAFAGTLLCVVLVGEAVREAFDPKRYARLR